MAIDETVRIIRDGYVSLTSDELACPPMGLSSSRASMTRHDLRLEIDAGFLIELTRDDYARWARESREDDILLGAPQDELAEAGYPALEVLTQNESLTLLLLGEYLVREWLSKIVGRHDARTEYWFDSFRSCKIADGRITFVGNCYGRR